VLPLARRALGRAAVLIARQTVEAPLRKQSVLMLWARTDRAIEEDADQPTLAPVVLASRQSARSRRLVVAAGRGYYQR
jgi:hypothetical protein